MLGRHYHRVYGYPWRWAFLAEVMWRIEHVGHPGSEGPLRPVHNWGYRWRKHFERKGSPLLNGRA